MSAKWTFWAWEQPIKTAPKKLALLQLANNANDDGKSWYSIGKMAVACGVSERTLQRQIQSLESDGLLQVERRSNRPSVYILTDEMCVNLTGVADCQGDRVTGQGDRVTGQGDRVTGRGVSECRTILTVDPNNELNSYPNSVLSDKSDGIINEIYNYWFSVMNKDGKTKFTAKRKSKIKARLKEGYTEQQIKQAIDGCANSPYHMGQNDNKTIYNDIELICRSGEKVEQFGQRLEESTKQTEYSKKTASTINNLGGGFL